MPPSITDGLSSEHLAWFVIDAVEAMDLTLFYAKYRTNGQGNAAGYPPMRMALLLYAYCHGERSSRRIENLCEESVPYRVITGNEKPDHCSISRFRKENAGKIELGRADAGYWNEADLERECGYEIGMATEKDWRRRKSGRSRRRGVGFRSLFLRRSG